MILTLLQKNLLLNILNLKNCVIKFLILVPLHLILFPIDLRLKKMCDNAFSRDPFMLKFCIDRYKTQEICDKVFENFPATLALLQRK